jgi:hypothetical protein
MIALEVRPRTVVGLRQAASRRMVQALGCHALNVSKLDVLSSWKCSADNLKLVC